MKFPKNVILESVAIGKDHPAYGLEFIQELGNDDAGAYEMLLIIFKYKDQYYSVDIQRFNGINNYDRWSDEIECPEVVKRKSVQYYWEEVRL